MKLSDNTILITGGSSGIGFELVRQLLPLKNTILITGRDAEKLAKVKKTFPEVHTFQSDVSDAAAIESLFEKVTKQFPELNVLINNAGIMKMLNLHEQNDLTRLTQEIEINLNGPIRMVQKFLPHLKKKSAAAIVNVTSGLAFVPLPTSPVYCSTKAALHSFTLSLRVQLKNSKVQVFELAPPATQTELLGHMDPVDMKGITVMRVEKMVETALAGMRNDELEIRPGQSNQLKFMSRVAPQFILNQLSRPVDRMLSTYKQ